MVDKMKEEDILKLTNIIMHMLSGFVCLKGLLPREELVDQLNPIFQSFAILCDKLNAEFIYPEIDKMRSMNIHELLNGIKKSEH